MLYIMKRFPCCRTLLKPQWALPHTPGDPPTLPAIWAPLPLSHRVADLGILQSPWLTTNQGLQWKPQDLDLLGLSYFFYLSKAK